MRIEGSSRSRTEGEIVNNDGAMSTGQSWPHPVRWRPAQVDPLGTLGKHGSGHSLAALQGILRRLRT